MLAFIVYENTKRDKVREKVFRATAHNHSEKSYTTSRCFAFVAGTYHWLFAISQEDFMSLILIWSINNAAHHGFCFY